MTPKTKRAIDSPIDAAQAEEPGMIYAMGHGVLMELPLETTLPEEKV